MRASARRSCTRSVQKSAHSCARQSGEGCRSTSRRSSAPRRSPARSGRVPSADPGLLAELRRALLEGKQVAFAYGAPLRRRKVVPYGLLFGRRAYLVARAGHHDQPALFRLDQIHDLKILDEPGAPPQNFDLAAYAAKSFGVF